VWIWPFSVSYVLDLSICSPCRSCSNKYRSRSLAVWIWPFSVSYVLNLSICSPCRSCSNKCRSEEESRK
jgi:MinD superfamily P-loop ATPase